MSAEQSTANIEKTKNIVEEIVGDLGRYLETYRSHADYVKGRIRRDKQESEILLQTVTSTLSEMKEENERLVEERNVLRAKIEQDTQDLKASEDEKHELVSQIKELEAHGSSLGEVLGEKRSVLGSLTKRADAICSQERARSEQISNRSGRFRRYLGMDIVPVRENVIRVVFRGMSSTDDTECSVTLDLCAENPVVDVFPRVQDVSRLNAVFRENNNFHLFLKSMREVFVREYLGK